MAVNVWDLNKDVTMYHEVEKWENKLKAVFDRIDTQMEEKYGDAYPLHPARAERKQTGNPEHDGLFQLGASFSAGYGSRLGAGYTVEVNMLTLDDVDAGLRKKIEDDVAEMLERELPKEFPGRDLKVEHDGSAYKIYGDLSLDGM